MFRIWGKIIKNNRIIRQHTAEYPANDLPENDMLEICLEEVCTKFDIEKPLWFEVHRKDFSLFGRSCFKSDAFMEEINFDIFEIELIKQEKDKKR